MKGEVTIKKFRDISKIKPKTAAVVLANGDKRLLTFCGDLPGKPNYLLAVDAGGHEHFISKAKLGCLLMGRKE